MLTLGKHLGVVALQRSLDIVGIDICYRIRHVYLGFLRLFPSKKIGGWRGWRAMGFWQAPAIASLLIVSRSNIPRRSLKQRDRNTNVVRLNI